MIYNFYQPITRSTVIESAKRNTPIRSISLMLHIFVCNFPSAESVHQSLNLCL